MPILKIATLYNDITGLFHNRPKALQDAIKNNPDSWFKPNNTYPFRDLLVCNKKFFPGIKVGDVFKSNEEYLVRRSSYEEIYKNAYSAFQKYEVNLMEKVLNPAPYIMTCIAGKYGCHRGCINSCFSVEKNRKNRIIYNEFKKWREKLLEKIKKDEEKYSKII